MKKVFSVLLALMLMLSCVINAGAIPAPCYYGDANANGESNVMDVTFIQEVLVKLNTMSALQNKLADVNADGNLSVFDATLIQLKLAKCISEYPAGKEVYVYMLLGGFETDKESGLATVNEPVTFTVFPDGKCEPFYFDYYVNGELIIDDSQETSFTYSFDEAGSYRIQATATNSVGVSSVVSMDFEVVEA
ncbi:MAG: hypothetical protein IJ331_04465 [Ruminococcus sp.]|nr:hypothetical protein [Ruminococcus sp.]